VVQVVGMINLGKGAGDYKNINELLGSNKWWAISCIAE